MQQETYNRVSSSKVFITKIIVAAFFVAAIVIPTHSAYAAGFTCINAKTVDTTSANLTVASTSTYDMSSLNLGALPPTNVSGSTPSMVIGSGVYSSGNQKLFGFSSLKPNTTYTVYALDQSNVIIEQIYDCGFKTDPVITDTPAATTASPQATTQNTPSWTKNSANQTAVPTNPSASATVATPASTASGLIPCDGPDCTVNSVMQLINNIIKFFFTTLLLPLFVIMIMYLGFSYLKAQGKPGMHAKLGSMAQHMVLGLVLILCAWVIVHTLLVLLGYSDTFGFFN